MGPRPGDARLYTWVPCASMFDVLPTQRSSNVLPSMSEFMPPEVRWRTLEGVSAAGCKQMRVAPAGRAPRRASWGLHRPAPCLTVRVVAGRRGRATRGHVLDAHGRVAWVWLCLSAGWLPAAAVVVLAGLWPASTHAQRFADTSASRIFVAHGHRVTIEVPAPVMLTELWPRREFLVMNSEDDRTRAAQRETKSNESRP